MTKRNKEELKKVRERIEENMRAYRRGRRQEELEDHNGKPFTSQPKTKSKQDRIQRVKHKNKEFDE